jgi:hypothetical protein
MEAVAGTARTPTHLWVVGGLTALWNAFGAFDYVMTQTRNDTYLAQFTADQRAWFDSFPLWADAAWALGVWGALAGSLLLLTRSRHAVTAYAVSLAGLLGSSLYQYGMSSPPASMMTATMIVMSLVIWAIAIALFVYARLMRARGVLR